MKREIKTKIISNPIKTKTSNKPIKTKIISNPIKTKIVNNSLKTKIISKTAKKKISQKNKIINMLIPPEIRGGNINEIVVEEKKKLNIVSYIDNKKREIFLKKQINTGSYNSIYAFSRKKSHKIDPNLIIRISNKQSTVENINTELKGIKVQYKLCLGDNNIGNIIDYGMLHNPSTNNLFRLQEYSIIERYGIDLKKILESSPKYNNLGVAILFMKNLLKDIHYIHKNNYAHLDIKPSNILMQNIKTIPKKPISKLEYAIVDFGAAQKFNNNNSKIIDKQMASAAFSPPELLDRKFGKKSDIWAYGIICYLTIVRKFYFKAKAQQIFMSQNTKEIERNVKKAIDNLLKNTIPKYIKSSKQTTEYLFPLGKSNFYLLQDFLKLIFNTDLKQRPDSARLLKHKLFSFV